MKSKLNFGLLCTSCFRNHDSKFLVQCISPILLNKDNISDAVKYIKCKFYWFRTDGYSIKLLKSTLLIINCHWLLIKYSKMIDSVLYEFLRIMQYKSAVLQEDIPPFYRTIFIISFIVVPRSIKIVYVFQC